MNFLSVLKFVGSSQISFIVSLGGLFFYFFITVILNRELNSFDDKILFPIIAVWALFLAALSCHFYKFISKYVAYRVNEYKIKKAKEEESRVLKENANAYVDMLDKGELALLFELLQSDSYTKRIDRSSPYAMNLESLGLIVVKKRIDFQEAVVCLHEHVVASVEKKFMPIYFENARKYFNHNDNYAKKVVDLFYSESERCNADELEVIMPYMKQLERFGILHIVTDVEKSSLCIHLNKYFSFYLEKIYDEKPKRDVFCIAI